MKKLIYTFVFVLLTGFQFVQAQEVRPLFYLTGDDRPVITDSLTYVMPETGRAYNIGIIFIIKNTSTADLAAGTALTCGISFNDRQETSVQYTLVNPLKKDSSVMSSRYWPFQIGPHNSSIGANTVCARVLEVSGVDNPSNKLCAPYVFTDPLSIADIGNLKEVNIFPNPVRNNNLKIENLNEATDIHIYNIAGQLIRTETAVMGNANIDVSNLPNSMYILKMQSGKSVRIEKIQILR